MSSDFQRERASLNQIATELQVHVSSVWRWTMKGVRGQRLRTILIGGRRFVQRCDLERFLSGGQPRSDSPDRNQRADDAGRILDSLRVRPPESSDKSSSPRADRRRKPTQ